MLKLVTIGGRSSASLFAQAGAQRAYHVSCILTTLDDGSSSGVIRSLFDIPAPGDIRTALAELAEPNDTVRPLRDLMEFRFPGPAGSELSGMAFGNLLLAALTLQHEDFGKAVRLVSEMLGVRADVLPVTTKSTVLCAELVDGSTVQGEVEVRAIGKPRIHRLFVSDPTARINPAAERAILEADLAVLGPGCLYTSLIACLAVPGVAEALRETRATTFFVANTTTTPGQTDGMSLSEHVEAVTAALGAPFDYVMVNQTRPPLRMRRAYAALGLRWLASTEAELARVERTGARVIAGDFIEQDWSGIRMLHKLDTIRHDGSRLLAAINTVASSTTNASK